MRTFSNFPHFLPRVYRVYKFPYISENATICNYPPCAYIVFTNSPYLDSFNIFYQSIFQTIRENRYKNLYSPVTFQAVQHSRLASDSSASLVVIFVAILIAPSYCAIYLPLNKKAPVNTPYTYLPAPLSRYPCLFMSLLSSFLSFSLLPVQ